MPGTGIVSDDVAVLLKEIRDNQREALALQREQQALQREHMAFSMKQLERAEKLNDRADAIQLRAGKAAKVVLWVLIPLAAILIAMMLWPWIRYFMLVASQ